MIFDVSVPIDNAIPVWPSDPPVKLTSEANPSKDGSYRIQLTNIEMGSHTGTHIDAPFHFISNGRRLNEIPLTTLIGAATVFEVSDVPSISKSAVQSLPISGAERVIFKTDNSSHWADGTFYKDFVYLEPDAAEFLADHGVKLVGIDYLSIDAFPSEKHPTHFALLGRNVVILEGLNLSRVSPGNYEMMALPLNLQAVDGAPTRVILRSST